MGRVESVDKVMAVEFLATTISELKQAGLSVAIKNVEQKEDRAPGVIIYVSEARLLAPGQLGLPENTEKLPEKPAVVVPVVGGAK